MIKSMKLAFILLTCISGSVYGQGIIHKLENNEYQIEYPGQVVNIYFNQIVEGFDGLVDGLKRTEEEKLVIVNKLKIFIDGLPNAIVARYFGVNVFPLNILDDSITGYCRDNDIVIETWEYKLKYLNERDFIRSFAHEIGHFIFNRLEYRDGMKEVIQYLESFRQQNYAPQLNDNDAYTPYGYLDAYSYGFNNGYKYEEEIATILGYLLHKMNIKNTNPEHSLYFNEPEKLKNKLDRFAYLFSKIDKNFSMENGYSVRKDTLNRNELAVSSKSVIMPYSSSINVTTINTNQLLTGNKVPEVNNVLTNNPMVDTSKGSFNISKIEEKGENSSVRSISTHSVRSKSVKSKYNKRALRNSSLDKEFRDKLKADKKRKRREAVNTTFGAILAIGLSYYVVSNPIEVN